MAKKIKANKKSSPSYVKSYVFRVIKILTVFFITLSITVGSILLGGLLGILKSTEAISPDTLILKGFTSAIYDSRGNFVMSLKGEKNREMVDMKQIPKHLKDAFVAIEDKRFYKHNGIDLKRIAGAVISYIKPGGGSYGGSTITQQVVKNVTGDNERSIKRKVQEQWRAIKLEKKLTKDEILEVYMNLIYMGENCYGVQAASKMYFGKPVSELTLAQSACLAGITNLPSVYDPFTQNGKENNLKRQKIILREMLDLNFITKEEYEEAKKEDVKFVEKNSNVFNKEVQPYFVDQVILDLKKDLINKGYSEEIAIKTIYNNGLKIYTTIDMNVQKSLDKVFENENNFSVLSEKKGKPQAAMVVLDAKNGQIRGLTGGVGKKQGVPFNRASSNLMKRQPGSTFKPIAVYGPAIGEGIITPSTIIDDVPVYMMGLSKGLYPKNYDRTYGGLTTIRDGVRRSINVIAARVWKEHLGVQKSLDYLRKVNIDRSNERYISLAMGGLNEGVNPLQMAAAYVPFVSQGNYYEPITYTKVCDKENKVLIQKVGRKRNVYTPQSAYVITNVLQEVPKRGTAYPNGLIKKGQIQSAGKTGTTSDNKDKWYVGYTPYYVAATWYGYDKGSTLAGAEYGRALKVWNMVMEDIHKNLPDKAFDKPKTGIVEVEVCKCSGMRPTELCYEDPRGSMVTKEIFVEGTEPGEEDCCEVHVSRKICTSSKDMEGKNYLANDLCPKDLTKTSVFIQRKEPYVPKSPGDPYPKDRIYETPSVKCKTHEGVLEVLSNIERSIIKKIQGNKKKLIKDSKESKNIAKDNKIDEG
ncbi:MAG: PBP1A family penicillin-binding protein [Clostridiales bacterium]|nr:PBP1A family penicillin-binding protein [Clostridiales bacterium]